MKSLSVILGMVLVACSSSEESSGISSGPVNECITKGAAYLQTFEAISGNCPGSQQVHIVPPDGKVQFGASCTFGSGSFSQGCTVYTDATCELQNERGNAKMEFKGKASWTPDGSKGEGIFSISISDELGLICSGVWKFSEVRQ